jgi:hypothetical protein
VSLAARAAGLLGLGSLSLALEQAAAEGQMRTLDGLLSIWQAGGESAS